MALSLVLGVVGAVGALLTGGHVDRERLFSVYIGIGCRIALSLLVAGGVDRNDHVIDSRLQFWNTAFQRIVQSSWVSFGSAGGVSLSWHYGRITDGLFGLSIVVSGLVAHLGELGAPGR
jgi:hypothetical protein